MTAIDVEILVVGSGASAVHAAWPLAEAGLRVVMVDVGHRDETYEPLLPEQDYLTLRRRDPQQHRYFLGDNFEGIPFGPVRVGAQLTPPRQFITRRAEELAPVLARDFSPMQSFALGGLAAGWGASTMPFIDEELEGWPLTRAELQPHYDAVAARIGICGSNDDDLVPFVGKINPLLPPARPDSNAVSIMRRYKRLRKRLNHRGFHIGHPRLAMATREFHGRGPVRYTDMEFWSDRERAIYRPRYTVEELQRFPNFTYKPGLLVTAFRESPDHDHVILRARDTETNEVVEMRCKRLVLAAGALGTARVVLASLQKHGQPVPLVCNPYTYFPCLNWNLFGHPARDSRHSLTQLTMVYDPDRTRRAMLQPQLYSYRSLLLFKLLKESPFAYRESIRLLRMVQEYFVIVGLFHADRPTPRKSLRLKRSEGGAPDQLELVYSLSRGEEERMRDGEKQVAGFLRQLHCLPLKVIRPGHGSSIHYGGCFPMCHDGGELTCTPQGALRAAPLVTLADGSTFPNLPAKGLTYTLMANADRVGTLLARELTSEGRKGIVTEA